MRRLISIALISAASLLYELALTRVLAVAQFHHFAFMLISLGLLGSGASGTVLALRRRASSVGRGAMGSALGFSLSAMGGYLVLNYLPFDSFSITWDGRQAWLLALNFTALAVPFLFAGLMVGSALVEAPARAHRAYAANLIGSALGCALVVLLPPLIGGERTVFFAAWLGVVAGAVQLPVIGDRSSVIGDQSSVISRHTLVTGYWSLITGHWSLITVYFSLLALLTAALVFPPQFLTLRLSPYKPLTQALRYPGAKISLERWSASARIDLVESAGIRSLPGLSYAYLDPPPPQSGLAVDGDSLAPITSYQLPVASNQFSAYLPEHLAFLLRPHADTLVIEPGGGLNVLVALASGAAHVTALHGEPLAVEVLRDRSGGLYVDPRVTVTSESPRAYLAASNERYDVIVLALADPYRPVTSGAYSLAETYLLTEEALRAYLKHLAPGGVLAVSRWIQSPPSEELRMYATILAALDKPGVDAEAGVMALRSFQTAAFFVRPDGFSRDDLASARAFAESRRFDWIALPGLRVSEVNRFNVLPRPIYSETFAALRQSADRRSFYADYPFDIRPATDDRPFFFHFFKWSQTPAALQTLGKTWQPFGGSGYFVLLALLALAAAMAGTLTLIPFAVEWVSQSKGQKARGNLQSAISNQQYFALLGFGFLLIEIPLAQKYIVYLGHPIYALATVLGGLLLFSGIGSWLSRRAQLRLALIGIAGLALVYSPFTGWLFGAAAGLPLSARIAVAVVSLAPIGLLMGMPFAAGLARLAEAEGKGGNRGIAMAWAVNGGASVVSAVLAAILALSFGFSAVLALGAAAYGLAALAPLSRSRT